MAQPMSSLCVSSRPGRRSAGLLSLAAGVALGALALATGCGRPDNLAIVDVNGLDSTVTELHVTLTLDGIMAKNLQPTADNPDTGSFTVYKDMQQFGVEVPTGTLTLGVNIDGLNTSLVVVRTGSGQVDLRQSKELAVTLHTP